MVDYWMLNLTEKYLLVKEQSLLRTILEFYWTLISVFWGADRQKCIKSVETLDLAYSDQYLEIKMGLT